jgi:hypothetical protein
LSPSKYFDSLNNDELAAVIAHETAHITARDNLKHWLMRICRDVLAIIPLNRSLDKEWTEAIELAADEKAASLRGGAAALDLAQALIKIARLVPAGIKPTMPAGAFLIDGGATSGDALTRRIQRLAQFLERELYFPIWQQRFSSFITWSCFSLLLLVVVMTAANSDVLAAMHGEVEQIVRFLS